MDWFDPMTYGLWTRIAITAGLIAMCMGVALWEIWSARLYREHAQKMVDSMTEKEVAQKAEWDTVCSHVRDLARGNPTIRWLATRRLNYFNRLHALYDFVHCAEEDRQVFSKPMRRQLRAHLADIARARREVERHVE